MIPSHSDVLMRGAGSREECRLIEQPMVAKRKGKRVKGSGREMKVVGIPSEEQFRTRSPSGALPLSRTHPHIAAQWHKSKNGSFSPDDFTYGSKVEVWWKCPEGADHVWQAPIKDRTKRGGGGCPFCLGRRLSVTNSLEKRFPRIAAELHPGKNGGLTPDKIYAGSTQELWWQCPRFKDHQWKAPVNKRTSTNGGCPFCSGRRVAPSNSLALVAPDIAGQLHPSKNKGVSADDLFPGSHRKVWWQCPDGPDHVWLASVRDRARGGTGCPFCAGLKLSVTNSLKARFPEIALELHPTRNGKLRSDNILAGSHRVVWWRCGKDRTHVWQQSVNVRTSSRSGCPFCANLKRARVLAEVRSRRGSKS
jgi:hypothetical protein